jgi:hypothetical protein
VNADTRQPGANGRAHPLRWLGVAVLIAVVVLLARWLADDAAPAPTPMDSTAAAPPIGALPGPDPTVAAAPPEQRVAARPDQRLTPAELQAAVPQGLCGRVVDGSGPLPGVAVYLLESAFNEPLTIALLRRQGLLMGPVAEGRTDATGGFALGLQLANEKRYDLHLVASRHADTHLADLRVLPGQWHDLGAITMVPGTTVRGSVTVEGTGTPVPGATVTVEAGSSFADSLQRAIPGREDGLAATTGADGRYELCNAPARGSVRLAAVAPGFARVIHGDLDLAAAAAVEVHFALPPGLVLHGVVSDAAGAPVRSARLEAWPRDSTIDPCVTHSLADGSFTILGLRNQPHRLRVLAAGMRPVELPDVPAGATDLRIELCACAIALVHVTTPEGRTLRDFRCGLRRWFPGADGGIAATGQVVEVPDQRVRLGAAADAFALAVPTAGRFAVQIEAAGWAKTLSAPFVVDDATDHLAVAVELVAGATLRGVVADENLRPLAGATVATQPDGVAPDNPFTQFVARALPDRVTTATATTGADGSFVLPRLAFGAYQLQIDHPEACRHFVRGLALLASRTEDLGAIRLPAGALVVGRATALGRVEPQIKVVLTSATAPGATPARGTDAIRLETVTDPGGAFALPRRVPPGDYELRAACVAGADPDAQAFAAILQFRRSLVRLTILPGQRVVEQPIDIPGR